MKTPGSPFSLGIKDLTKGTAVIELGNLNAKEIIKSWDVKVHVVALNNHKMLTLGQKNKRSNQNSLTCMDLMELAS